MNWSGSDVTKDNASKLPEMRSNRFSMKPVRTYSGMLNMWRLAPILLCLFAGSAYSDPPPPPPSKATHRPQTNTEQHKNGANQNQQGTEMSPLFIKIVPPKAVDPESSKKHEERRDYSSAEWWLVYLTGTLCFITLVLAGFTGWLWHATKSLVLGADDTAKRQLRAYVTIEKAMITGLDDGDVPTATLVIKNAGQTPAHKLEGMGGIAIGTSWEAIPQAQEGPIIMTQSSLGPGCTSMQFHQAPRPLHSGEMTTLCDGSHIIFVYGEMRYIDTFDNPHIIKYRFQVGGSAGIRGNQLAICPEGNLET